MGEKLVEQEAWDPSVLQSAARPAVDYTRYAGMGDITADEVIDFHYAVERLGAEPEEGAEHA
jgi:hypothetical protein